MRDPASRRPRSLHVFARAPEAGRSKTRLVPRVGAAAAAELHAAFLADVCARTRGLADERVLSVAGATDHPVLVDVAAREGMVLRAQPDGDLGRRMAHAIRDGLCGHERVCIVGSDSPALDGSEVARAFELLDGADVVIAPADDGGYWLVGARVACDPIFEGIDWGTGSVLAASLARAADAGIAVVLGARHWDVDEPADLDRLAAAIAADPSLAPATRAVLARLGMC